MTNKQKAARGRPPAVALDGGSQADAAGVAEAVVVTLPADCRIAAQSALKASLVGALVAGKITLDGSAVEQADTAALQLLMLFQREMKAHGGTLDWSGTSDALNNAAGLLGLSQTLGLPAAALA